MIIDAAGLHRRIDQCMQADRHRLRRRIKPLAGKSGKTGNTNDAVASLLKDIDASAARLDARKNNRLKPNYPEALPVVQQRDVILDALSKHQVVIICGETGSGKTTPLVVCLRVLPASWVRRWVRPLDLKYVLLTRLVIVLISS